MPKIRRREDKYEKLKVLLRGRMSVLGLDFTSLAPYLGCSRQTVSRMLNEPANIKLEDLPKLARALDIPADELRAAIPMQ